MLTHRITKLVVQSGELHLSGLPFCDGQCVEVTVSEKTEGAYSIHDARELLRGAIERFDQPLEPVIPADDWEMLK